MEWEDCILDEDHRFARREHSGINRIPVNCFGISVVYFLSLFSEPGQMIINSVLFCLGLSPA